MWQNLWIQHDAMMFVIWLPGNEWIVWLNKNMVDSCCAFEKVLEENLFILLNGNFTYYFDGPFLWKGFEVSREKRQFTALISLSSFYHLNLIYIFLPSVWKKGSNLTKKKVYYFNHFICFSIFYQNIRRFFQEEKNTWLLSKSARFFFPSQKVFFFFVHEIFPPIIYAGTMQLVKLASHETREFQWPWLKKIKFDNLKWSAHRVSWFGCLIRFQRNWYRVCLLLARSWIYLRSSWFDGKF